MRNIFEGAYFGKEYRTKDNTIVRFIKQNYADDFSIYIPKCKYSVETTHRYNSKGEFYLGDGEYGHGALDIISEWEEEIDEEELDDIVNKLCVEKFIDSVDMKDIVCNLTYDLAQAAIEAYEIGCKAGYRKALEKNNYGKEHI